MINIILLQFQCKMSGKKKKMQRSDDSTSFKITTMTTIAATKQTKTTLYFIAKNINGFIFSILKKAIIVCAGNFVCVI